MEDEKKGNQAKTDVEKIEYQYGENSRGISHNSENATKGRIDTIIDSYKEKVSTISTDEDRSKMFEEAKKEIDNVNESRKNNLKKLGTEMDTLKKDTQALKNSKEEELKKLQSELNEQEEEEKEKREELDEKAEEEIQKKLEEEKAALEEKRISLQKEKNELEAKKAKLEAANPRDEKEINNLEELINAKDEEISTIQKRIDALTLKGEIRRLDNILYNLEDNKVIDKNGQEKQNRYIDKDGQEKKTTFSKYTTACNTREQVEKYANEKLNETFYPQRAEMSQEQPGRVREEGNTRGDGGRSVVNDNFVVGQPSEYLEEPSYLDLLGYNGDNASSLSYKDAKNVLEVFLGNKENAINNSFISNNMRLEMLRDKRVVSALQNSLGSMNKEDEKFLSKIMHYPSNMKIQRQLNKMLSKTLPAQIKLNQNEIKSGNEKKINELAEVIGLKEFDLDKDLGNLEFDEKQQSKLYEIKNKYSDEKQRIDEKLENQNISAEEIASLTQQKNALENEEKVFNGAFFDSYSVSHFKDIADSAVKGEYVSIGPEANKEEIDKQDGLANKSLMEPLSADKGEKAKEREIDKQDGSFLEELQEKTIAKGGDYSNLSLDELEAITNDISVPKQDKDEIELNQESQSRKR